MNKHNNSQPYACDTCEHIFSTKNEYISHMNIHNSSKSFSHMHVTCVKIYSMIKMNELGTGLYI